MACLSAKIRNAYQRLSEADSITKVPGPKLKTEMLLRLVAASLVLPQVESLRGAQSFGKLG